MAGLLVLEAGLRIGEARDPARPLEVRAWRPERPPEVTGPCDRQREQARLLDLLRPAPEDPGVVYRLQTGLDTCFAGARVTTNSLGLRSERELAVPKAPGSYRVAVLGDSQVFGMGVETGETLPAALEELLGSRASPSKVEVINAGVPGYNAYQEAALLAAAGESWEPDCVLMLFTANDLGVPNFLMRPRPRPSFWSSRLWAALRAATGSKRWWIWTEDRLRDWVTEVDLERVPAEYRPMVGEPGYRAALEILARWTGDRGVAAVNVASYDRPRLRRLFEEWNRELGITHLPFTWPRARELQIASDDPHPNAAGHRVMARRLVRALLDRGVCQLDVE
ncbi:MAG: SGNH/GDSL hydrolase family protein [Thermoanaerobaculia bacterium]|nr:SGNH/GDSL hydrolase family protein [Thermoanaerobaculia bacterium]